LPEAETFSSFSFPSAGKRADQKAQKPSKGSKSWTLSNTWTIMNFQAIKKLGNIISVAFSLATETTLFRLLAVITCNENHLRSL